MGLTTWEVGFATISQLVGLFHSLYMPLPLLYGVLHALHICPVHLSLHPAQPHAAPSDYAFEAPLLPAPLPHGGCHAKLRTARGSKECM